MSPMSEQVAARASEKASTIPDVVVTIAGPALCRQHRRLRLLPPRQKGGRGVGGGRIARDRPDSGEREDEGGRPQTGGHPEETGYEALIVIWFE
jgi:hypothetical protein